MAFPKAPRRSVSFPRGTMVTYVTRDVFRQHPFDIFIFYSLDFFIVHDSKQKSGFCVKRAALFSVVIRQVNPIINIF